MTAGVPPANTTGKGIRYPAFQDLLIEFARSGAERLRPILSEQAVPTRRWTRVERESRGHTSFHDEESPEFELWVLRHLDEVKSLPELTALGDWLEGCPALKNVMLVDGAGEPVETREAQDYQLVNFYAIPFLIQVLKWPTIEVDEAWAHSAYAALENSVFESEIEEVTVAPLNNFESDVDRADLGKGLTLREFSDWELQQLWNMGEYGGFVDRNSVLGWYFALEIRSRRPKAMSATTTQANRIFFNALTAFRLVGPGAVGIPLTMHYPVGDSWGRVGGLTCSSGPSIDRPGIIYRLSESHCGEVARLLAALENIPENSALRRALDRFDYGYDRHRPHDRIIDHWVALEALVLKRSERMELGFRAALRLSRLLGGGPVSRQWIFTTMRKSYNIRSDIVHGSPIPSALNNATAITDYVLRRALSASLNAGQAPDLDELDMQAVRADKEETIE